MVDNLLSFGIAGGSAFWREEDFSSVRINRAVGVEDHFLSVDHLIGRLLDTLGIEIIDLLAQILQACQTVKSLIAEIIALAAECSPAGEKPSIKFDASVIVVILVFDPAFFQDTLGTENIIIISDLV